MMLHIGCGNVGLLEFTNIDCRQTEATDIVANAWDLHEIASDSVEYIYSRHMLEHLSNSDAALALLEWRRVLQVGGIVHIVVPNLLFHARQLLGFLEERQTADDEAHAMAGFYGWQNDSHGGMQEDLHRWGYTHESLARLLKSCGLTPTDDGIEQLIAADDQPWHVNVRAIKER